MTRRPAFTLIELLCAIILLGLVGTTIARLLVGQQRFYASVAERLTMRSQLRDGADLLTIALRYATVQTAPITLATDSAIQLSSLIGAATVCGASGARIDLAPEAPASGIALTTFAVTPDSADDVLVYDRGTSIVPAQWRRAHIASVTSRPASALCAASPLLSAVDVASTHVVELTTVPAISVASGAPVRIIRDARFDIYHAGDGRWYLGYRRCGFGCTSVQPISGPYDAAAGAVTFRYFDTSGAALATPVTTVARITRVDIVLRASSHGIVDLPGSGRGVARDSTIASIALRNAP